MTDINKIIETWAHVSKETAYEIIGACKVYASQIDSTFEEFLKHCIMCGGAWNSMLYSGMKELLPAVYNLIPENGLCIDGTTNFMALCYIINLCGYKNTK